jgi:Na+-driven multidrug efflux pump
MNVFTSLDIAANSLVASYMGRGDPAEAQRVLLRVLRLGVTAGAGMAVLMVGGAGIAPAGFTADPGVRAAASRVFPLLGVLLVRQGLAAGSSCRAPEHVTGSFCSQQILCNEHGSLHAIFAFDQQ